MNTHHKVENLRVVNGMLYLSIDGNNIQHKLKELSTSLANANEEEQNTFAVSPSGYGIYWPLIDEDISIDGLLGILHKPDTNRKSA